MQKTLSIVTAVFLLGLMFTFQMTEANLQTGSSFTFFAGGDFGATSSTARTLAVIRNSSSAFTLALGDLSYQDAGSEPTDGTTPSPWCNWVKARVGNRYPFQLLVGNHEDSDHEDGFIDNFAVCLPDRMSSTGRYGVQYYFDYPRSGPLMRVIMIAADNDYRGVEYDYDAGTAQRRWLINAIDNARARGIPWIAVGIHKNCLSMGTMSCEIGSELFTLLVRKRVDLILQGHDHNYQRSTQLRISSACSAIPTGSFNARCVIDNGLDDRYTAGLGTVIVIAGAVGGNEFYSINCSDSERFYFASAMGGNGNAWNGSTCSRMGVGRGIVRYTVTASRISARFMMSSQTTQGTRFTDEFHIIRQN